MQRTLVTCVAKKKSGSQEVGTRSNPDLVEGKMFRGEGGNGLTFRKFLVFLFELLISTLLSEGMGLVSFFIFFHSLLLCLVFFKEDNSYSIQFLEGSIAWIDHSRWIGSLWRFWVLL